MSESADQIETDLDCRGYALIEDVTAEATDFCPEFEFDRLASKSGSGSLRISPTTGLVQWLLARPVVGDLISRALGNLARPVRAIAFDKTAASNWSVPWHQDRTIAVDRRAEEAEVRNWSIKADVHHCEPPVRLLEEMVTLRWHLDPVGSEDGCLRVLPGSHLHGRLTAKAIAALLPQIEPCDIPVRARILFAMRPLLVHSSRRRATSGHRRVLHVELASGNPPEPLQWAWAPMEKCSP